jgi:hypothetical protein
MISVANNELCPWDKKVTINNVLMNECDCFPIKLYSSRQTMGCLFKINHYTLQSWEGKRHKTVIGQKYCSLNYQKGLYRRGSTLTGPERWIGSRCTSPKHWNCMQGDQYEQSDGGSMWGAWGWVCRRRGGDPTWLRYKYVKNSNINGFLFD